jgi:hypothetical protein
VFCKCRSTARDAWLDSSYRDVEDLCDLPVVKVGDITQYYSCPEIFGKVVQCIIENDPITHVLYALFGHRVDDLDSLVSVIAVPHCAECRSAFALAELIERGVRRDAICPRAERGTTIKARKISRDLDQRFLTGIVSVTGTPSDPATDCMDAVVVKTSELVERVPVTTLSGGDKCSVV